MGKTFEMENWCDYCVNYSQMSEVDLGFRVNRFIEIP